MSRRPSAVVLDAARLRARRKQLAMTQEELAEAANLTVRTIQTAERGKRVSVATATRIGAALGLPYFTLVAPSPEELAERLRARGLAPLPPPEPWGVRDVEEHRVVQLLSGRDQGACCLLSGPTGIGKTALARRIARRLAAEFTGGVAWIAAPEGRWRRSYACRVELADAFGFRQRLPNPDVLGEEAFGQSFREWLWRGRRLLVIDNVARPEDVRQFDHPDRPTWLLATTANRAVAEAVGGELVELGPLDEGAALSLLAAHIGPDRVAADREGARRLVTLLGAVPRSLQIAGRVLQRERYTRPRDYAERVAASPVEPRELPGRHELADRNASFTTAYRQLRSQLPPAIWQSFGALSVFGHTPFSLDWACGVMECGRSEACRRLGALGDYYLLREIAAPESGDGTGAPTFALDVQSQRAARWIASESAVDTRTRLLRFAGERAQRVGGWTPAEQIEAFVTEAAVWRLALDLATEMVLPEAEGTPEPVSETLPAPAQALTDGLKALPHIVVGLDVPLRVLIPPGMGEWLMAGASVARAAGDSAGLGRIAALLAIWAALNVPDLSCVLGWSELAAGELLAAGCVDESVEARAYAGKITYFSRGPDAALPQLEAALEVARERGANPTVRAGLLNSLGTVLCLASSDGSLETAQEVLERALDESIDGPGAGVLDGIIRLNLGVVRKLRGATVPSGVEQGLDRLRRLLADDPYDAFRLDALGRVLDLEAGGTRSPLDAQERRHRLVTVSPEGYGRRLSRFREAVSDFLRCGQPPREPDDQTAPPALRFGVTGILIGTEAEFQVGRPGLLYPMAPVANLLNAEGVACARDFVAETAGASHPAYHDLGAIAGMLP